MNPAAGGERGCWWRQDRRSCGSARQWSV